MSWSFSRLSLAYAGTAAALVLILFATTASIAIHSFWVHTYETGPPSLRDSVRYISLQRAAHRTLEQSAIATFQELHRAYIRLSVIDANGQQVFDSAPRDAGTSIGTGLIRLFGMPTIENAIPGGRVIVSPNPTRLFSEITQAVLLTVPAAVLTILALFGLAQVAAREPTRSGSAESGLGLGTLELPAISAAYNAFAQNLERAVAERERTAENIRNFVADAGHELKTPLTVIIGYLDTLVAGLVTDPQDMHRVLEKTLGQCRRMRTTIERLTLLARLDRYEPLEDGAIDVAALVLEVAESMRALVPNLNVEVPKDERLARAFIDEAGLREAIINVIDNARKYAPQSPVEVHVSAPSDCVLVEISDEGPGMTRADLAHAFERFHRGSTSTNVEGSGLGLAIAKRAIERANGRVTLTSRPGQGTTVAFYLPIMQEAMGTHE